MPTLNTVAYIQDSYLTKDKVQYVSPTNSFTVVDNLTLARTPPKKTADFDGVARAEAKRTLTVTLANGKTASAIVYVGCSLPVGMAKASADALRDDIGDFALSADCEKLFWNHDLNA